MCSNFTTHDVHFASGIFLVWTLILHTYNNFNSAWTINSIKPHRCSLRSVLTFLCNYISLSFPCLLVTCDRFSGHTVAHGRCDVQASVTADKRTICCARNSDIDHFCFQWFIHLCHAAVLGLNINDALCLLQGHIQSKYGPSNQRLACRFREQGVKKWA